MNFSRTRIFFFLLVIFSFAEAQQGPVLIFMGTRPETIKLLPLQIALQKEKIPTVLCSTGQHKELVHPIFELFQCQPDVDFAIMKKNQDLFYVTEEVLQKAKSLMEEIRPQLVIVQGDTTTAMAAALAAFYLKIPIAHVEAGLRTYNLDCPFPEEMNRRFISLIATLHFAPTLDAVASLMKEGIKKGSIFLTGNTVIDALQMVSEKIAAKKLVPSKYLARIIEKQKSVKRKLLLLTAHRRESLEDQSMERIFKGIKEALGKNPDLFVIFPLHPNPKIRFVLEKVGLEQMENLCIIPPVLYHDMAYLLNAVDFIATDSGGIQEEGVYLRKPVLILREETDRPEGLSDLVRLVGSNSSERIAREIQAVMNTTNPSDCAENFVYGDGRASEKITKIIKEWLDR